MNFQCYVDLFSYLFPPFYLYLIFQTFLLALFYYYHLIYPYVFYKCRIVVLSFQEHFLTFFSIFLYVFLPSFFNLSRPYVLIPLVWLVIHCPPVLDLWCHLHFKYQNYRQYLSFLHPVIYFLTYLLYSYEFFS